LFERETLEHAFVYRLVAVGVDCRIPAEKTILRQEHRERRLRRGIFIKLMHSRKSKEFRRNRLTNYYYLKRGMYWKKRKRKDFFSAIDAKGKYKIMLCRT